ncbi:MAG: hypothetical protein COA96_09370 [SAR86 cluster bacterium]|uniref:Pilus assembly protein n=1 Tax=SAR86 cluster bacterium TaxID=2030880 RepID=A0A2A5B048_9GAMM|nr:MAG: hypothetical protein COA96_09370 [SAR86 cluster bacterium]
MTRWRACGIHFSISLVVFLLLLTVILLVWYPGILFSIDGGWTGLQLLMGVDLVLGPMLTLIVFKAGKPGLKFDLSCIAIAQIFCMTAGMWVVYKERPIALVLAFDTFYSVAAQEFEDFGKDPSILENFPGPYPKLIYTQLPEDEIEAGIANMRSMLIGDPLYIQTENYRAIETKNDLSLVFRREQAVRNTASEGLLAQLDESCLLSNFISSVTSGYVCFNRDKGEITEFYATEYLREGSALGLEPVEPTQESQAQQ